MPGFRSATVGKIGTELTLTEKERAFARYLAEGKRPELACTLAGYKRSNFAWELLHRSVVMKYVQEIRDKNERMLAMSRKKVMDGFLDAIEQAKLMSEPMTQIAGWREIAKMCGYYAPEVRKIDINVTSQRVMSQLETLSDADLLELIEKDAETIEGEARELLTPSAGPADWVEHEAAAGTGEPSTGAEEFDSVRASDVPEVQSGVGA